MYPVSRGATALLINRTSGKGLIVDSTSANGPLFRNLFLTSIFYTFFHFSRPKKGVNLLFFQKINILIFFSLSLITIYPNGTTNIINTIKDVLVSIKPKLSDKLINFEEKNASFTIFRKVQIIFKITKNWNRVSLYLKKLPKLYGIKIKISFKIYRLQNSFS